MQIPVLILSTNFALGRPSKRSFIYIFQFSKKKTLQQVMLIKAILFELSSRKFLKIFK